MRAPRMSLNCSAIVLLGLFVLAVVNVPAPARAEPVTILAGEWEPFVGKNLKEYGPTARIVTAALQAAGYEPTYEFYPWVRGEKMIQQGQALAIFPYMPNDERKAFAYFSPAIAFSRNVFFYHKDYTPEFEYTGALQDLQGMAVGGATGYFYEPMFKEAGVEVDYASDSETGFKKLAAGRIAIFPDNELVGWAIIERLFPEEKDKFAVAATPMQENELAVMISRQHPDAETFRTRFNEGLAAIEADGTLDAILQEYGLTR